MPLCTFMRAHILWKGAPMLRKHSFISLCTVLADQALLRHSLLGDTAATVFMKIPVERQTRRDSRPSPAKRSS
jgi:hypothetical protein